MRIETSALLAHVGGIVRPDEFWSAWTSEPTVAVGLTVFAVAYGRGARKLRASPAGRRAVPAWRLCAGWAGIAALVVALMSPLDGASGTLFSFHMGQHIFLVFVAPPLLVLGRAGLVSVFALPDRNRQATLRVRSRFGALVNDSVRWPILSAVGYIAIWIVWHLPGPYQRAIELEWLHGLEHVSFVVAGLALWWLVVDAKGRHATGIAVVAVLVSALGTRWLAGLLTFGGRPWYGVYEAGARAWGITLAGDQQFGAGLMWFPGGLMYLVAGAGVFYRWLGRDERYMAMQDGRSATAGDVRTAPPEDPSVGYATPRRSPEPRAGRRGRTPRWWASPARREPPPSARRGRRGS